MFKELNSKAFLVGGAVRNQLLGKEAQDLDYVIADTTEEEFLKVFTDVQKVGNSFPVYIIQGNEIALARTEISVGTSYTSFEFVAGVSIVEDLSRRDFTINSMAKNVVTGELVDPHNGLMDLKSRIIRTINPLAFKDDALRIYRGLRFASEFNFSIEANTFQMMKEAKHLLSTMKMERVALELEKMYERSETPSTFFKLLLEMDALQIHFKPLYVMSKISSGPNKYHGGRTAFEHVMDSFDYAKTNGYSFDVALAALFHDTGKGITKKVTEGEVQHHYGHEFRSYDINKKFVDQHRFTAKQNELIVSFAKNHMYFHLLEKIKSPVKLVRFFKKIKNHFSEMIQAANSDHPLNENQLLILNNLKRTFKETEISVPKEIAKRGREAVVNYVDNQYAQKYKEISE